MPHPLRFRAYDGTPLACPGATGADYRLNLGIDLLALRFHAISIRDIKTGESLQQYQLQPGDVAVGDQGYCSHAGLLHAVYDQGADVIVRWNHHRQLYETQKKNQRIDFCHAVKDQRPGTTTTLPVLLKYAQSKKHPVKDPRELFGHLHLYRMTTAEAQAARKRVSRKRQKKQKKVSEKPLFLSQFVFVLTSLAVGQWSAETILAIYRCRWQIELAIKRMKSLIHIDKMRAQQGSQ